jgi:hypothetical protein
MKYRLLTLPDLLKAMLRNEKELRMTERECHMCRQVVEGGSCYWHSVSHDVNYLLNTFAPILYAK